MGKHAHGVELSVSATHACLRLADGSVQCWGLTAFRGMPLSAELGRIDVPTVVPQFADVVQSVVSRSGSVSSNG